MTQRFLIVDGHSVIFAWPDLRARHDRHTAVAREELVRHLTAYQDFSGVRVVVVFDGQGSKVTESTEPGGIQIFYSRTNQTADSVIERLAAKYGQTHDLTVATSDFAEQQTAITFGASVLSADGLRSLLEQNARDCAKALQRQARR